VFVGNVPGNFLELVDGLGLTGSQIHFGPHVGSISDVTAFGVGCFPPGFKTYLSMSAQGFIESEGCTRSFISSFGRVAEWMRSHPEADKVSNLVPTLLLDSGTLQQPGGTGAVFDWQKAAPIVEQMKQVVKIVVAGGLNPANVSEAIHILQPWGVDVSSGVESKPGKKDSDKVRAFVAAVHRAERIA
jgi:hypothetical protein